MKYLRCLFFVPFAIVGVFAIIFAFRQKVNNEEFFKKAKQVDAVIDQIVTRRETTGTGKKKKTKTEHDVYVTYTVDGVEYEHIEINSYSSSWSEGGTITLHYNPENPKDVRDKETSEMAFPMLIVVGCIFTLVGLGIPVGMILLGNKGKKLINTGIRCQAEEFCIEENRNVRVNGRHPLVVYCRAVDPRDNSMKEFKSKK